MIEVEKRCYKIEDEPWRLDMKLTFEVAIVSINFLYILIQTFNFDFGSILGPLFPFLGSAFILGGWGKVQ